MLESYEKLIDKHVGESVFVIGSGTSLFDLDLVQIHEHVVISVNSSFIRMPWADGNCDKRYWISNDSAVREWSYWKDVKEGKCIKIIRNSWKKYYDEIPDFLVFSPRKKVDIMVDPNEKALCYSSSVPSAIDLAIQMGCNKIFLLGVDHYFLNQKSHFWQLYPKQNQPIPLKTILPPAFMQQYIFDLNKVSYDALRWFADFRKVRIYNCNPLSKIKFFEKINYHSVQKILSCENVL